MRGADTAWATYLDVPKVTQQPSVPSRREGVAVHPALASFTVAMDTLVAEQQDPVAVADGTCARLRPQLADGTWLADEHRATSKDGYQEHVVHVLPEGRYSLVALVWLPGQSTPIHDHRCWCVVGVLEGDEQEERFRLHANGEGTWLERQGVRRYHVGQTCRLVPPDEDIHRVTNVGDAAAISLHVYGADIRACGTSINRTFDRPVRDTSGDDTAVAWRDRDPAPAVGHR